MKCAYIDYNGVMQYFTLGAAANLNIITSLSIDAWIKVRNISATTRKIIFNRFTGGVGGYHFNVHTITPGKICIGFTKGGVVDADSTVEIQNGRLTHVAAVWDSGTGNIYFYRDGVLLQTYPSAGAILTVPAATAYVNVSPALAEGSEFWGCIYNINIYNRALSTAQILYNKEHPNNPTKRGCQLMLTQESFIGGVWKDLSGNGYDGTAVGSPILNPCNNVCGRNSSV